ncbi:MAG TPA: hypothetical protein VKN99_22940, partial [Polyangia bacterium]|nr:hypothetical protein [Polyangia bacterium]
MQNHRNRRIVTGLLWILGAGGCGDNPVAPGPDGAGAADALANDSATLTDGPRADAASGVVPSNSGDLGGLEHTGLTVGAPSGNFDTDTDCVAPSALGNCRVAQPSGGLPEVCVCRSDELTIGSLQVSGARALALFALRSVTVSGTLDVSGRGLTDGAGAARAYASASDGLVGGTGGSYASSGGGSGAAASYGEAAIIPLQGGMRGQDACSVRGGGAGGALQVSAGEQITVTGRIQAGGGGGRGGRGGGSCLGGAGGGSGGAVLLEAPMVAMTGAAAANGAGGGGGGSTSYGQGASGTDASGMAA